MHVLLLGVPLFEGMAGSVRVRNLLDPLIKEDKIEWSNLYFSKQAGNFQNKGEAHVMEVEMSMKSIPSIFRFLRDSFRFIKNRKVSGSKNLFYAYDTPDLKTIFLILYAKSKGYKVILDIVEDNSVASSIDGLWNWVRIKSGQYFVNLAPYYADLLIGISHHLHKKLSGIVKDISRVIYIPVTVDLQKIKVFEAGKKETIKIFYGGSFGKKDGLEYLIGAFSKLNKVYPSTELILTGKGESKKDFDQIFNLIQQSEASRNIKYLGFLNSEDYLSVLSDCDIFCVTRNNSLAANTGFPSKLAEFLASGKAVVASDVGDVGKLLVGDRDLILVPPENEDALFDAFSRVMEDESLIEKYGKAGRIAAKEIFDNRKYSSLLFERMNCLT